MNKSSNESSKWSSPKTLVPIILAIISLIGAITSTVLSRKTVIELQLSKGEVARMSRDIGFAMNELNQYNRARNLLEIALRHSPKDGDIFSSLGYSYLQIGLQEKTVNRTRAKMHLEESVNYYKKALILEGEIPADANHWNLGRAFLELQKPDEAEKNIIEAKKTYERNWMFMADLGRLYLMKDEPLKARAALNAAATLWAEHFPGQTNKYLNNLISENSKKQNIIR